MVSHVVRAFTASALGADPASSFSAIAAQSTGGKPVAPPKLMIFSSGLSSILDVVLHASIGKPAIRHHGSRDFLSRAAPSAAKE